MISRQWTGLAKKERAGEYIAHLQTDTFPKLTTIGGFLKASVLKRETHEGIEFLIITEWDSLDAIRQFAGPEPTIAVVPPFVQSIMVSYDKEAKHYTHVA
jgi:hypothetical protein